MKKRASVGQNKYQDNADSSKKPKMALTEAAKNQDLAKGGYMTTIPPPSAPQRLLRCPVCNNLPILPIFNCAKGHIVCSKCRPKLQKCCVCNDKYTDSRNFILEQIVESGKIACEYREKGCLKEMEGKDYANHVNSCEFGPVTCFNGEFHNCNMTMVDLLSYKQHLIEVHNMDQFNEQNGLFWASYRLLVWSDGARLGKCFNFDGKTFVCRAICRAGSLHMGLVLVGTDADAKQYKVRMTFSPPNSDVICYDVTVPVRTIRVTNEELSRKCFHAYLTKEMIKSFSVVQQDGTLNDVWKLSYTISMNVATYSGMSL